MIETIDDQTLLEYGPSDMRLPIFYALSYRKNVELNMDEFVKNAANLHFFEPNDFQNKVLNIAKTVLNRKGNTGCILNSANDLLVEKFLNKEINFLDIYKYIELALKNIPYIKNPNLEDIISTNNIVKYYLHTVIKEDR
jgi:1-deoxy-D-xylulose-5-phosphate reductoisomerase